MSPKFLFKHLYMFLRDSKIDIRIRMIYFLEYATLVACVLGAFFMMIMKQSFFSMIPNFILLVMSVLAIYLCHAKKKYDLSAFIMILGCANISLPWMYFSAGGSNSGMPIWFVFGLVVTCMMSDRRIRSVMAAVTIVEDLICIAVGHFYPETVAPLVGKDAVFIDFIESYAVACTFLSVMLIIYINTYDNQRQRLMEQSIELGKLMKTDVLTGVYNRRAYYDEINLYKDGKDLENLVLVAMDVNGLKKVNDKNGHAAGDEYIKCAANAATEALSSWGHVFRTGGDEFTAILHCSKADADSIEDKIKEAIASDMNPWKDEMTMAVGVICVDEMPGAGLEEIEKIADKRMYENKAAFYRTIGVDRRK